jgi:D-alanyl-D-alanine carboxypeptidase/D-alanyl-D-alanine-endopeptidase (penicillin-binding protein 4)
MEAGIREVRGDLVVDGSYFSGPDLHPEWDPRDLNDPFAAPVASVSFNENILTVRVEAADAPEVPPIIETLPTGSGIPVVNTAITTAPGTRSRVWLFRERPSDPVGIEGEIPLNGREVWRELPVPDPLTFTGRQLLRALEARGITVTGRVRVIRDPRRSILSPGRSMGAPGHPGPRILGRLVSPPLLEILRVVNKESNNLLAETVAKTLGRVVLGEGSFHGGTDAVGRFLNRDVGIPSDRFQVRDGSGLSFNNHVSARGVIEVLAFMARSPEWEEFWSTLPVAGVRRELGRMGGSPAARNLRAKTGTMHGVSALSGMVRTRSGERVLFSILSNDVSSEYRAKRVEDQLGIRLASLDRPTAVPAVTAESADLLPSDSF